MTPRLRTLFVAPDVHLLVIDRMGALSQDQAVAMVNGTRVPGVQGTLIFPFEVDIPDDADGIEIHADERAALGWAIEILGVLPVGADQGELHPDSGWEDHLQALRLLLTRIEERL